MTCVLTRTFVVAASILAAVSVLLAQPPVGLLPGTPIQVGRLDSTGLDLSRPRLFATLEEISRARTRMAADPTAAAIRQRLLAACDEQMTVKPEPLDESWWQAAKDKPWLQTYPDVYLHTCRIPGKPAQAAADLALAWRLTDQSKYAEAAASLLMSLADYSFAPEHYDVGMNYTGWGVAALKAYDLLGERLNADQRGRLDAFMTRLGAAVAKNDALWIANNIGGGINNHLAWHKQAMGMLGLFYGRNDLVEYCLSGPRGMVSLLGDGLVDDGLWCESSLTYQFAAIVPMLQFAEVQQRVKEKQACAGINPVEKCAGVNPAKECAGINPAARGGVHEITAANGRTLKQAFDAMFAVLAPDCLIPPIGDAYGARTKLWKVTPYESGWRLWRDPAYAWLIRQNPEPGVSLLFAEPLPTNPPAPPIASTLLPEHGYAFLRSHRDKEYWNNPEARCAFLTYDRSGVHANADKLSLMLFGGGRMLVSDVEGKNVTGPHAFSSRIQGELNRGGLSQNTVMIDGTDQRCAGEMLDLIEYHDVPDDRRVTAADPRGILYPGVRQMRTIAMTPDYVLDVFQVDCGGKPRQIDWIAHVMDETAAAPPAENPLVSGATPFVLPKAGGYSWLRHAVSAVPPGDKPLSIRWQSGQDRLRLHMLNAGFERAIFCGFPATDAPDAATIPMIMVRAQASRAVFAAIWLVGDKAADASIRQEKDHEQRLVFAVTSGGRTRLHQVPRLP